MKTIIIILLTISITGCVTMQDINDYHHLPATKIKHQYGLNDFEVALFIYDSEKIGVPNRRRNEAFHCWVYDARFDYTTYKKVDNLKSRR